VRRPAEVPLPVAAARVRALAPGLDTRTWRELMPTLASMLDSTRGAMYTMFVIVYLAIGILILNAMLMAVFERIRELGILKALGFGPGGVVWLIFLESAMQVGIAVAAGSALATPLLHYLSHTGLDTGRLAGITISGAAIDRIWRASVSAQTYLAPIGTLVVIVLVAIVYPALKAAAIRPVDAIHHR
jgi:ABC-type lipoprotein release transport system permease subunit